MSLSYLFGMFWDKSAILSCNLKHFNCQCKWMSMYFSLAVFLPHVKHSAFEKIYGVQILPNKPFQILSAKNPSQENAALP